MIALRSARTRNLDMYQQVHLEDRSYGTSSEELKGLILKCVRAGLRIDNSWTLREVLDFGCGKSNLIDDIATALSIAAFRYDPAIEAYASLPVARSDLVINTDVLEHLDEHEVDLLIRDIRAISDHAFFHIATVPAAKVLPSGENAHATVQPPSWWKERIAAHFGVVVEVPTKPGRAAFVTWRIGPQIYFALWGGSMMFRIAAFLVPRKIAGKMLNLMRR